MTYLVSNLSYPLSISSPDFKPVLLKRLGCRPSDLLGVSVYRRSVDARKKNHIKLTYTVAVEVKEGARLRKEPGIRELKEEIPAPKLGNNPFRYPPVVVGFGPAGMFCGLMLARAGFRPIILEQGAPMEERTQDVERFWKEGSLDPNSNIQFGEGGAGTFSDGKLMTRISDGYCRVVLDEFIKAGAPEEIRVLAKPHIGTDLLRKVVVSLRNEILSLGGEIHFHTKVLGFRVSSGRISALRTSTGEIPTEVAALALGNGARETFSACLEEGIGIKAKPFSVGVRIEHRRNRMEEALYGDFAGNPLLGAAEYQLSERDNETGRAVYTFCMCPGGLVIPAASEEGGIVTNGMSYHARDGVNSNSALVVSVDERDFGSDPLAGLRFQRELEHRAFILSGSFRAPSQTVGAFLGIGTPAGTEAVTPSYVLGTVPADLHELLPRAVSEKLEEGLSVFGKRLPGFDAPGACLTAPETRTSSPVRFLRDERRESETVGGVFPCGEGSGYAGGIMSAAVDGIHAALMMMEGRSPD